MISSAAQSTPRARLALARASNSAAHQTRQYQYGPWHVEAEQGAAARPRSVRYRYMETMSTRLAWDNKSARIAAQPTPPYVMAMSSTSAARTSTANVKSWSDELSGMSPKPVGAVDRLAVEELLRPQQDTPQNVDGLRLPLKSVRDYVEDFAPTGTAETVDAAQPKYKDLDGYKAASFDDPICAWELTAEETSKRYNDLHKYGPVRWNEPDGLQPPSAEELSKNYEDLGRYAQYETASPQDPPKHYVDAPDTQRYALPQDSVERAHPQELSKRYGHLSAYQRIGFEEPSVKGHASPVQPSRNHTDLTSYHPVFDDEVAFSQKSADPEFNEHDYEIRLKTAAHQEPISGFADATAEFNEHDHEIRLKTAAHQSSAKEPISGVADAAPNGTIKKAAKARFINLEDAKHEYQTSFESEAPGGVTDAQPVVDVELEAARRLEQLKDGKAEYAAEWGAEEHVQPPVAEQLETVAEKRLAALEDAKVKHESTFEAVAEDLQARVPPPEKDDGLSSMDESFPPNGHDTVQEALTKVKQSKIAAAASAQVQLDPFSKTPQGLEVSYSREIGGDSTRPTQSAHYPFPPTQANATAEQASPPQAVRDCSAPADYIVLAFDPMTQMVHVAETSSAAENDASAQTPAEVILRLSNPAKFFPHFKPLRAQGYEIVSGRGDVLVFRKVHAAAAGAPAYDPSTVGRKRSLGKKLAVGTVVVAGAAYGAGTLAEYLSINGLV